MITDRDMIAHIGLEANFNHKVLEWDDTLVLMKYPGKFLEILI